MKTLYGTTKWPTETVHVKKIRKILEHKYLSTSCQIFFDFPFFVAYESFGTTHQLRREFSFQDGNNDCFFLEKAVQFSDLQ